MGRAAGDAAVVGEVDARAQARIARLQHSQRLLAARWKSGPLPDLVEPARVAAVALQQLLAAHPQPPRDPDVDRVRLGERAAGEGGRGGGHERDGHGTRQLAGRHLTQAARGYFSQAKKAI